MNLFILLSLLKNIFVLGPQANAVEPMEPESQFSMLIETNVLYGTKLLPEAGQISTQPKRIQIEGTSIDLPIKIATVSGNEFEFFEDAASFLENSAYPGEPSNMVLYAHNEPGLFSDLHNLSIGEEVRINTENGVYRYVVKSTQTVEPNEVQYIAPTGTEQLTLITCVGKDRSHRLIVVAIPIESFSQLLEIELE